ncbi:hypothetical protein [Priestia aryabhattai]|uniref:hypothetical protein n=1 Tax=Priestia aryabhattai TaxID=412384 RepID=UPI003D2B3B36
MKNKAKNTKIVDTFNCSNGGVIRVRGKNLDTSIMARFFLGLPQVAQKNDTDNKKTA